MINKTGLSQAIRAAAALSVVVAGLGVSPALAQQAYFRGEAQSDASVIVNLSVIEKLTRGTAMVTPVPQTNAPQAPLPQYVPVAPTTAPPAMPSSGLTPAPAAPAPSTMPKSTLMAPGTTGAAAPPPAPAVAAPVVSTPPPKPAVSAPPPKPAVAAPKPAPAPTPAPDPAPVAAAAPAPEPAPEPKPEPAKEPEITAAPPPPAPIPETAPAPAPAETPAAPAETAETAVASVDLTAVDTAGIEKNSDGLTVLFTRESQDLPIAAEPALAEIAEAMKANPSMSLKLLGYSEKIGDTPSKPRRLSLFRALAVRTYLLKQGIDSRRMTVQALGAKDEGNGRPENRVDLVVSQG